MLIESPTREAPISYTQELLSRLSDLDVLRLKGAAAAVKYVIEQTFINQVLSFSLPYALLCKFSEISRAKY